MRTTIDLDAEVLVIIKHLAMDRKQSLGRVLSDAVRQSLQPQREVKVRSRGIPVLARKPGARPVTSQTVKDLSELES